MHWHCAVCGRDVPIETPLIWRCPAAGPDDPRHVLHLAEAEAPPVGVFDGGGNPFHLAGPYLAWWRFAAAHGLSDAACHALTEEVAADFPITPYRRSEVLSDALGIGVVVKDETVGVAGSHKARFLVSALLHLRACEELGILTERPPLAIASCGNAALAAATLARRVDWPVRVFVPEWMNPWFAERMDELGAEIVRCRRRPADPPGDPAIWRFREAVAAGAIPFSVQGPENAWCLDGGRTIGWEMRSIPIDRVMVQVGGGALAACVGRGLGPDVRLHAVQAAGCAPLAGAWERARRIDDPARHWSEVMIPWENPTSIADGILDDETYDWVAVVDVMERSGGGPIVVAEDDLVAANELARAAGFRPSPTGSAGLAGLMVVADRIGPDETVAVVMSGLGAA